MKYAIYAKEINRYVIGYGAEGAGSNSFFVRWPVITLGETAKLTFDSEVSAWEAMKYLAPHTDYALTLDEIKEE